jgi:DDE superfamily endonuclease
VAGRSLARLAKRMLREQRQLILIDESGFSLLPGVVRTYAPRGVTPELRVFQTRDHLAVISGVTPEGRLYAAVQDHSLKAVESVAFLKHLLRYVSRKRLVVWDRAPIQRGHVVEDFLAKEAPRSAIHLEPRPPYAPESTHRS